MLFRQEDVLASSFLGFLATLVLVHGQFIFDDSPRCKSPLKCQPRTSCQPWLETNSFCDFQGNDPWVCCPPDSTPGPTTTSRPTISSTPEPNITNPFPEDCGRSGVFVTKIVGGEAALPGAWPWMVGVFADNVMICGGSLISEQWVLTAAHCVFDDNAGTMLTAASRMQVRMGTNNMSSSLVPLRNISKVVPHADYGGTATYANDICLLRMAQKVTFGPGLKPVCLAGNPQDIGDPSTRNLTGYMAFIAGWGKTSSGGVSSPILLQTQIPIWSDTACRNFFERIFSMTNDSFCAGLKEGGKDSCQGDSGGPLVVLGSKDSADRFYVVGVVSFGMGCARPGVPGGYTKVRNYWSWISLKIRDN